MGWIDYRKVYYMVPYSWGIESLNMMGIAKDMVNFWEKRKVEPECGTETLNEKSIKREIFQGNALSQLLLVTSITLLIHILRTANLGYEFWTGETINYLLFMDDLKFYSTSERALDSLIQTVRIFSEDTGMQFWIDKCAMLVIKKGKILKSDGTELLNEKVIKSLEEEEEN